MNWVNLFRFLPAILEAEKQHDEITKDDKIEFGEVVRGLAAVVENLPGLLTNRELAARLRVSLEIARRMSIRSDSGEDPGQWLFAAAGAFWVAWGLGDLAVNETQAAWISRLLKEYGFTVMYGPEQDMPEGKIRAYVVETG